jgi:hypothetical protein
VTAKLGRAAKGSPQANPYSRRISHMAEDLNGQIGENKTNAPFVILIHEVSGRDRTYSETEKEAADTE